MRPDAPPSRGAGDMRGSGDLEPSFVVPGLTRDEALLFPAPAWKSLTPDQVRGDGDLQRGCDVTALVRCGAGRSI